MGEVISKTEKVNILEEQIRLKIKYHEEQNTNGKFVEGEKLNTEHDKLNQELSKLKIEVRNKLDKIEKLGDLEYDEDCDYCMKNPFTLDAIETQKSVDNDKQRVKEHLQKMDEISYEMKNLPELREAKLDLDDNVNKLQQVSALMSETNSSKVLLDEKRKNVLHQLTSLEEKIVKYYEQENDIMFNQQIENEIQKVESELDDINNSLDMVTDNTNNIFGEIKVVDTKRRNILDNIKKVEELEDKYEAYQYYLDAVKRDGVPYDLITKALPTIEGEVNNIL